MTTERKSGRVAWFNARGFGFVTPDDGTKDLFVHYSGIAGDGHRMVYEGQRVEFRTEDSPKGLRAVDVRVIAEEVLS